jgi:hypothetical protein
MRLVLGNLAVNLAASLPVHRATPAVNSCAMAAEMQQQRHAMLNAARAATPKPAVARHARRAPDPVQVRAASASTRGS